MLAEAPGFDFRRERVIPFIDKLTGYLIGGKPLPLAHRTCTIAETFNPARWGVLGGGAGGCLPRPVLFRRFLTEKKAVPPPGRRFLLNRPPR